MKTSRIKKQVTVAAGFLFLGCAPGLACAQNSVSGSAPPPYLASPEARPKKQSQPPDDFAGLTYTDEQKAKIDQIRQDTKQRMDVVKKDEKLAPEAKQAMLDGYQRLEIQQLFKVLTPEQQAEVRKKATARRAAEQQKKQNSPPRPQ
jgi:Spy/CpxP family protein refolding chaperone